VIVVSFPHLRKYSPDGEIIWDKEINFGRDGHHAAIGIDRGDSIVIGGSGIPTYNDTWIIMKYAPNGDTLWKKFIGFPFDSVPRFADLNIDNQNNILMTGFILGTLETKWLTFKLSPFGKTIWLRTFSSNWMYDWSEGVCADDSLNVIVSGVRGIYPIRGVWYPQIYKYSPTGDSLWSVCYFDTNHYDYSAGELTTDKVGNIILPGSEEVTHPPGNYYAFLFKYDPQGNLLWKWFDDTTASSISRSCVTDTAGNIYVAGAKWVSSDTVGVEIRKFQPNGEPLWEFFYPLGLWNNNEAIEAKIDLDQLGNILLSVNKDTFVYIFKITETGGISEHKINKTYQEDIPPTVIVSKKRLKIVLPFYTTQISIYSIGGRLIYKTVPNDNGKYFLFERIATLPEGIYFIEIGGENRKNIKLLVLD
jgi:hypothetical protein